MSYTIGDYVIVSHPDADTDYPAGEDTFVVKGFTTGLFGQSLVRVRRLNEPSTTVFYPHELSWEDGTRP